MSAAAAKSVKAAPRAYDIGERAPVEMAILRDGTIRMRERGRRKVFTTSVANVFFSAVRSETLTDIRRRQRRAAVIAQAKNGGRRCS
jgi:hypothetical protein